MDEKIRICRNCKNWNYDDECDSDFADCNIIGNCNTNLSEIGVLEDYKKNKGRPIIAMYEDCLPENEDEYEDILKQCWLETYKDFGCIHWEKK